MNTIRQHQFYSPGISNVPTTLEEISSKLADSPSPTHEEGWEKEVREHFKNVYYGKNSDGYGEYVSENAVEDFIEMARSLLAAEERKVRERLGDWVEAMWDINAFNYENWNDKDEVLASIQSYLEGKHNQV